MREAQGWSGRTSPRIGPLSTRSYTSFPRVFLHRGSLALRRRRPESAARSLHASPRAAGGVNCEGQTD
jgi:hypothetical protein